MHMQHFTMKLDEIVTWYQKKIGTYDKQQWEKTVEQKILDGFSSVTLKTAKLKTELIDVDLVRGSTFPKAKSKQSLLTVIRLAILRYFLLPIYAQWWVTQTSANCFAILLVLYIMQMINWAIYTFNVHRSMEHAITLLNNSSSSTDNANITTTANASRDDHIVSLSDLLIPMSLGLLLSLIHSQIVATNTASGNKSKRRRFSNANPSAKHARGQEARTRRRKKLVKVRSMDISGESGTQQRKSTVSTYTVKKMHSGVEVITKSYSYTEPIETDNSTATSSVCNKPNAIVSCRKGTISSAINKTMPYNKVSANTLKLDLNHSFDVNQTTNATSSSLQQQQNDNTTTETTTTQDANQGFAHKKRNVNWHSPIHNYATETMEKQQQTSPQVISSTTTSESNTPNTLTSSRNCAPANSSSSCSASNSPTKSVRIDECVQEFYDDLINRTDLLSRTASNINPSNEQCQGNRIAALRRHHVGEDDGFESLNGKSSSGEETNSPLPSTSSNAAQNELRLRLNAGDSKLSCLDDHLDEAESSITANYRRKLPVSSESDYDLKRAQTLTNDVYQQTKPTHIHARIADASTEETEEEGDDGEIVSSPASAGNNSNYNECTTSATEWLGVTTNSEECSCSSEIDNSDNYKNQKLSDEDGCDLDFTPTTILNPYNVTDKISCTVWDQREIKKAQLSVLEISSCIIERVESMPETNDYIYFGLGFSVMLTLIPSFCRLCEATIDASDKGDINYFDVPMLLWEKASFSVYTIFELAFGFVRWERTVLVIAFLQRLCLTAILFMIFSVAERTFKQRFLYAKLFSHLTSSRRARKSNVPHFRLNKVRNIKAWLSVRSYLKKRGPQRSVDVIVSAAFIVTLLLLAFLSVEWLKDSVRLHSHLNLEALLWSTTIGIFLLRFMTLGNKIHDKYRSVSVLITEQINLYLQIEQKPKKKEELMVANSVLKLASDLLKELETPFKISGLSANPYLFTTIKVVILSALSGVLSEMLGFKLKLHKIKIK